MGTTRHGQRHADRGDKERIREGYNLSGLGGRLPAGLGSGLVLVESSHKAR